MSVSNADKDARRSPFIAGLLSLVVPGLGQVWSKDSRRGLAVFAIVASTVGVVIWYRHPAWYVAPVLLWIWNVWDAVRLPKGASVSLAALLWLVMAYGVGWQVTEISPMNLIQNRERASSILRPMLEPDSLPTARRPFRVG